MDKEIAIIIPAYNAHDTIKKAFYSIAIQNILEKIQVILVDDCSIEPYDYLLKEFPQIDLTIIRKTKNYGPGEARNQGIISAYEQNIPYIMFLDADDIFSTYNAISTLYYQIKESDYDRVEACFAEEGVINDKDKIYQTNRDFDIWLFAKIYKTNLIIENNIFFPKTKANEDVVFNAKYSLYCKSNYFINSLIYIWQDQTNSITRINVDEYAINSMLVLIPELISVYQEALKNYEIKERAKSAIINRTIRLYWEYVHTLDHPVLKKRVSEWDKCLNQYYNNLFILIEEDLSYEDFVREWSDMSHDNSFIPKISFWDFLKKIRRG